MTKTKIKAIAVLTEVANLRANFRLAKILDTFKQWNQQQGSASLGKELKRHHAFFKVGRVDDYSGPLTSKLFDEFEALFEKGDGARMDFDRLSKQPVDTILLDCLMYEDDELFARALELLERKFGQRKRVMTAVRDVTLCLS